MNVDIANFSGDTNIGLYCLATDAFYLTPHIKKWVDDKLAENLKVKPIKATIAGTNVLGIFAAGNSNGLLLPELARRSEVENIKKHTETLVLKGKYTAIGNLVLSNDKGCIIADKLKKYKGEIEDFLKVKATVHNIAGLEIIGSLALATNKGCLVSKYASKKDMEIIANALGVRTDYATINFGSNFVRSGLIANSMGAVLGELTSGPEVQNIIDVLQYS